MDYIHEGIYPEEEIQKVMTAALNMLNDNKYDFLIRVAVFHYMFGYIHPFYDGNGRVSRFISSCLLSDKLNILISYRLSCTISKNRNWYYKSFQDANNPKNKGELTSFVINFLDIIIESINELCESLDDKIMKINYYSKIIKNRFNY